MSLVLSATATPAQAAHALAAVHALLQGERHAEAASHARRLRRQHPHQLAGYTLEARALLGLGRPGDALAVLRALPAGLAPDFGHLQALGTALARLGEHAQALPVLMQALTLKIDDAGTHYLLGNVFNELGLKAESAECLRTAVALGLQGSELAARGQLVFREREACRWAEADTELALLRERLATLAPGQPCETSPFGHAVLVAGPAEQLRVARHHALHVARRVQPLPPRRAVERERLRVGYLSADFHNHATSQLLVHTLEHHDRARFEIHALSTGPDDGSALRRRVVAAVEHFHDLRAHGHTAIAQRVRELGIDLLIDLKGATHDSLLPVLAQRAAPLQASWLGFPGSTGAPYIDYLIGDPVVTPLAHAAHFAEAIAQLPLCYQPNDAQRARPRAVPRAEFALPDAALLLCGFHQPFKISAAVFDVWCGLLAQRPDARLWLLDWNAGASQRLRDAAHARGIDPARLLFAPRVSVAQHLRRLSCADLFLDTWPCNAHTTAGEALWAGVPVLSLRGQAFAQRVAASLLHALDLDELVVDSVDAYVAQVLALAGDAPRRALLRERLLQPHALFDGEPMARALEALWLRMWQRALAGKKPAALPAVAA